MERRDFLRVLPIAAVSPKVVKDGILSLELPSGGHYVILIDAEKVPGGIDDYPKGLLPPGSTGGWVIYTMGPPDEAIKFYNLKTEGLTKS